MTLSALISKSKITLVFSMLLPMACAGGYYNEDTGELVNTEVNEELSTNEQALVSRLGGVRVNSCDSRLRHSGEGFRVIEMNLAKVLGVTGENETFRRPNGTLPRLNVITNFSARTPYGVQSCRVIFGAGGLGNLSRIGRPIRFFLPKSFTDTDMTVAFRIQHFQAPGQNVILRSTNRYEALGQKFRPGTATLNVSTYVENPPRNFEIASTVKRETCSDRQDCELLNERLELEAECKKSINVPHVFGRLTSRLGKTLQSHVKHTYYLADVQIFGRSPVQMEPNQHGLVRLLDSSRFTRQITGQYARNKYVCAKIRPYFSSKNVAYISSMAILD